MWSLQGGAGKAETTKKHVREKIEMQHTLSLCLSLLHTHARLSDSALLLSEMIG